jgi:hemerythrin-like metal-binding protein
VSIGIAIFPDDGAELDKLMSAADSAMYQSKAKGRNTYTYANEQMRKEGEWVELDSSYLFGVEEIDRQHHELADMLNKLNAAVQHNQPEEVVAGLFHEFIGKIQIHFEAEERLMEQHVQDMHGLHKKEHQRLIGEVAFLRENLSKGAELAVLQSLKDWLLGHVKGLDRQLSEALLQRGVT